MSISRKILVSPRNVRQADFLQAVESNTVIFSDGPAGTGKTFLAVACALKALKDKEIKRIIITRPAVEAGEKLGFLPGDLQAKLDPYMRPIFDAFRAYLTPEEMMDYLEKGIIEISPLAYMRGRTLSDCFIILDEAQNTTPTQMKMFLTRLGNNSKMIVNGDMSQIDLPGGRFRSGLIEVEKVLYHRIPGVAWIAFTRGDIVRHPVVKAIVSAYERYEDEAEEPEEEFHLNGHSTPPLVMDMIS